MPCTRTMRRTAVAGLAAVLVATTTGACSGDESATATTAPPTAGAKDGATSTGTATTSVAPSSPRAPGHPVRTGGPTVQRDGRIDETGLATMPPDGGAPPHDPEVLGEIDRWPEYRLAAEAARTGTGTRVLGSGCTPSDAVHLPDGLWYGYVDRLSDGMVSFDLACWWVGDLATVAGCEGQADLDSCVLNTSDRERTVALALDATFHLPRRFADASVFNVDADFDEFAAWLGLPGNTLPVWVKVGRGALVEVEAGQQLAG